MASPTLNHPLFGPLLGLSSPNGKTIQYRNLKYASIPGRFRNPVPHPGPLTPLNHSLAHRQPQPAQAYDATKHGPSCPQHPGGWAFDLSLIGMGLEGVGDMNLETEAEDMDEFGCLHAVVTVPAGEKREGLPVVVFVHGGGFSVGSNSWPQYDLSKLVATSVDIGKPIIGVSVNYRLGPFGFLSSPELGSEGNLGLKDLVCAFKWIHTNISSFYGSPRNITALGESAGSILLSHLLHLPATIPPLFHSAILMSGDSSLRRARSPSFHAKFYQNFLSQLGLSSHPVAERIEVLKSMPARDMVGRLPMFSHWSPASGTFLPDVRLSSIANGSRGWCQRVVMGDNAHDGSILAARVQNHPDAPSRLSSAVSRHLSPSQGTELCEAFGLAGRLSTTQRREGLLTLGSEVRFYYPILCWEAGFSSPSSLPTLGKRSANPVFRRYHFHVLNPLLGATQGLASHELDLAFLLGNFAGLEENCPGVGDGMRKLFVGWIGGETWGRAVYDSKSLSTSRKRVAVVGLEGVKWCSQEEYDVESRGGRGTMLREWDVNSVFKVAESLQGVGEEMEGAEVVKGKL